MNEKYRIALQRIDNKINAGADDIKCILEKNLLKEVVGSVIEEVLKELDLNVLYEIDDNSIVINIDEIMFEYTIINNMFKPYGRYSKCIVVNRFAE